MDAIEPGVRKMKKNLAVRAGAIILVLMVAFLSIIPDLVNAEGDSDEPSTEVTAEAPETGTDVADNDAEVPETPETGSTESGATDWSAEEVPPTETPDAPETPDKIGRASCRERVFSTG